MLKTKIDREILEPKLFFIVLQALENGNLVLWHTAVSAFTLQEAEQKARKALQVQNPQLWQNGEALGGFKTQGHIELKIQTIDEMLTLAHNQRDELQQEIEAQEKNDLMQTILETASRKLLQKYSDVFSDAEVGYLEDKIAEYERNN